LGRRSVLKTLSSSAIKTAHRHRRSAPEEQPNREHELQKTRTLLSRLQYINMHRVVRTPV
jgi:hypothetical protein